MTIDLREKPIIFSSEMVKAILSGSKTMTRRQYQSWYGLGKPNSPFQIGQRLWVKETFWEQAGDLYYKADWGEEKPVNMVCDNGKWKPSIFMPRWASRITLEITEIRVERLQEITEEDCYKEGCKRVFKDEAVNWFKELWDSLNAKRGYSWGSNPWCWVISF